MPRGLHGRGASLSPFGQRDRDSAGSNSHLAVIEAQRRGRIQSWEAGTCRALGSVPATPRQHCSQRPVQPTHPGVLVKTPQLARGGGGGEFGNSVSLASSQQMHILPFEGTCVAQGSQMVVLECQSASRLL